MMDAFTTGGVRDPFERTDAYIPVHDIFRAYCT